MKNWLVVLVIPLILFGCVAGPTPTQADGRPSVQVWEYLTSVEIEKDLKKYGADGWELVTIYHYGGNPIAVFKRPKR